MCGSSLLLFLASSPLAYFFQFFNLCIAACAAPSKFATTQLANIISSSISDGLLGVSTSLSSNSFTISFPPLLHAHSHACLSPVTEGKIAKASSLTSMLYPDVACTSEPGFDMVTRCTLHICPSMATLTLLLPWHQ